MTASPPISPNSEAAVLQDMVHVLAALRGGDFNRWLHVPHKGPGREVAQAINEELSQLYIMLQRLVAECTRVTRSIGTDGEFGREAEVPAAAGAWKQLIDSLNDMSTQLTIQVRRCNQAVAALAKGGEVNPIMVDARGETQALITSIHAAAERQRQNR